MMVLLWATTTKANSKTSTLQTETLALTPMTKNDADTLRARSTEPEPLTLLLKNKSTLKNTSTEEAETTIPVTPEAMVTTKTTIPGTTPETEVMMPGTPEPEEEPMNKMATIPVPETLWITEPMTPRGSSTHGMSMVTLVRLPGKAMGRETLKTELTEILNPSQDILEDTQTAQQDLLDT